MNFFRSEPMVLSRLILHQDNAFDCLVQLGYLGKVQFLHVSDADAQVNNKYTNHIQRCEEVDRTIKRLQGEINKSGLHTVYFEDADTLIPKESDLPIIERALNSLDSELTDVQTHCDGLQIRRFTLYEHIEVLRKMQEFLSDNTDVKITSYDSIMEKLIKNESFAPDELDDARKMEPPEAFGLIVLSGSIPIQRFPAFELMIWRLSRGNALVKHKEFELPEDLAARYNQHTLKYAFMVACVGESLKQKIMKACQGFQVKLYSCASTRTERQKDLQNLQIELDYVKTILERSCEHKKRVLAVIAGELFNWRAINSKMHQVYNLMNHLGVMHEHKSQYAKYLRTDCWIPRGDMLKVRKALLYGSRLSAGSPNTLSFPPLLTERILDYREYQKPPTHFRNNKFTQGFQNLIDSYGMASYREANPAPYTIITFPFLFAVMFGDIGHGLLMALFAFVLICREKKILRNQKDALQTSEIFDLLFAGRYIILLMGLFSIYTGLMYNETFAKPLNLFGSSWHTHHTFAELKNVKHIQLDPANRTHFIGTPYILGMDPVWTAHTDNTINTDNSIKMKIAIILGVFQMMFGLSMSAANALFFRNKIDFFLVFLPQIIFLSCLFFYLVVLVFVKWSLYGGWETGQFSAGCAPSILITFINMILMKQADAPPKGCSVFMFEGQHQLQLVLLALAVCSIPVLLCGKPLHFMYQHRRIAGITDPEYRAEMRHSNLSDLRRSLIYNIAFMESDPHLQKHETEESLSELWIHQGIHTIECVLGSVSHTASYLRLWALSLAHAQLSDVLWKMVLSAGLHKSAGFISSVVVFFSFAFFAVLTVAILVIMEGLSAFLHTLRLHWVEFQSKFYEGLGDVFIPFQFQESRKKDSYT